MAKLSKEKIAEEVAAKGFELVDASNYENINSEIDVKCKNGHTFRTSLVSVRSVSFCCPHCDRTLFVNPNVVPQKNGYRVIAFDQATEKFGLSIFDNGELVFYNLYSFTGHLDNRLTQIRNFIRDVVIKEWKPDYIVMEDIQQQHGAVLTYKVLAMLLGVLQVECFTAKVPYEIVSPNVWRKYAGTCGKTRLEEKKLSVITIQEKYGVRVNDDVAEAILIGRYGAHVHKQEIKMAF